MKRNIAIIAAGALIGAGLMFSPDRIGGEARADIRNPDWYFDKINDPMYDTKGGRAKIVYLTGLEVGMECSKKPTEDFTTLKISVRTPSGTYGAELYMDWRVDKEPAQKMKLFRYSYQLPNFYINGGDDAPVFIEAILKAKSRLLIRFSGGTSREVSIRKARTTILKAYEACGLEAPQ
jgi:hypothetical protein